MWDAGSSPTSTVARPGRPSSATSAATSCLIRAASAAPSIFVAVTRASVLCGDGELRAECPCAGEPRSTARRRRSLEEPPRDRELWPWLVVLLVLVLAALIGAWLASATTVAVREHDRRTGPGDRPRVVGLQAPAALVALPPPSARRACAPTSSGCRATRRPDRCWRSTRKGAGDRRRLGGAAERRDEPSNGGSADLARNRPRPRRRVTVPDVRGQKVNDARKQLRRSGSSWRSGRSRARCRRTASSRSRRVPASGEATTCWLSRGPAAKQGAAKERRRARRRRGHADPGRHRRGRVVGDTGSGGGRVQRAGRRPGDDRRVRGRARGGQTRGGQAAAGSQVTIYVGRLGG